MSEPLPGAAVPHGVLGIRAAAAFPVVVCRAAAARFPSRDHFAASRGRPGTSRTSPSAELDASATGTARRTAARVVPDVVQVRRLPQRDPVRSAPSLPFGIADVAGVVMGEHDRVLSRSAYTAYSGQPSSRTPVTYAGLSRANPESGWGSTH